MCQPIDCMEKFNKNNSLPHPKTVLISMGSYQPAHLMLPLSLLAAHAAGQFAILFRPQQSFAVHSHGDQGAMLLCGITPQFSPMCVAHLYPAMIATAGLMVEIDPVLGRPSLAHCVIVIHEAALAMAEPAMHIAF